jgi:hypothetical protein
MPRHRPRLMVNYSVVVLAAVVAVGVVVVAAVVQVVQVVMAVLLPLLLLEPNLTLISITQGWL